MNYIQNITSKCHSQTNLSLQWRWPGPEKVFSTLYWQANLQLWRRVHKIPSIPINSHAKEIEPNQDEMVNDITKLTSKYYSQTNPSLEWIFPKPGNILAPSADNQTHNYDKDCSKNHRSLSSLTPEGLCVSKMKWWAIYKNLPLKSHSQTTPSLDHFQRRYPFARKRF